jgi:hypothetical protein
MNPISRAQGQLFPVYGWHSGSGDAPYQEEACTMPTTVELKTRREALAASRSSGVARVSYDGRSVDYRSITEIDRAIEVLDREIATAEGRKIIRQVRVITTKGL